MGLSRRTVVTWLAAGAFPERATPRRARSTLVAPYAAAVAAYYDAGGANAAALARTLATRGYRGTATTVRRALCALRGSRPRAAPGVVPPRPAVPAPAPRQVAWLLRKSDPELDGDQRAYFATSAAPFSVPAPVHRPRPGPRAARGRDGATAGTAAWERGYGGWLAPRWAALGSGARRAAGGWKVSRPRRERVASWR